jgi:YegS/Rv2252/BmrU family lipid kinase
MHKTLLIFNPNSDNGHSGQKASDLRAMVEELGGADWRGTEYPTHATQIAAEAALQGYDTIVALGGDGTVHEIINGLMKIDALIRPRLGIVPIGSGNDFASALNLPADAQAAVRRALTGTPRPIDVVLVQDGGGRLEYFDNTMGIGFDAAVNIRSRQITRLQGFLMYLTATLQTIAQNFDPIHMHVTYDGGTIDEPVLMLTLGNGPREGGGFMTTPDSKLDDGMLDFVWIRKVSQFRMLQLVPKVMNATHVKEKEVRIAKTTRLVIDADRAMPIHLDGELWAPYEADVRHVEIGLIPGAVQVLA